MKRSLLLQDICDILVNRSVMTADQRSQILARQKELRARNPGRNNRHTQSAQRGPHRLTHNRGNGHERGGRCSGHPV